MRSSEFWLIYILLLLAQLLLGNYFTLTPYLMLSILPVMVLCIPIRVGSVGAMIIAFATGLVVDLLSEGVLGLNALALVPVAWLRNPVISLVFGNELFARNEDFSATKSGIGKVALALFIVQAVFTLIYVWADGASVRPFWFNATRFGLSLAAGFILSLMAVPALAPDTRR
ncbi:MAG: hypothetical protein II791_06015 [Bacteroidales bacterium]|jgi:rod shape-determining protein MreD|nr:hypothetical protein [Bacteroidales bacterium]MBQ7422773.1 hypothetical protein [Prevotella sp.]